MRSFAVTLTMVLMASPAMAQPPQVMQFQGGGGPPGGGRMMMMGGGDPDQMFNMFAKGKDVINRADLEGWQQGMFDRFAQRLGITNGQISRDQFKHAVESRMREGGGGGFGGPPNAEQMARFLDRRFQGYDKNGDGLLDANEMPDALKAERDKWDANHDGFVDLNEYKAYAQARFGQRGGESPAPGGGPTHPENAPVGPALIPEADLDVRRPVVLRYGKLPKDMPSWFAELDTDCDGQVGLYEWVKGSKPISEFREMDGSDDGFLTPEELLRFNNNGKSVNFNVVGSGTTGTQAPSYSGGRDGNGFRPWVGDRPRGGPDGNSRGDRPRGEGRSGMWWGNMGGGPGGRPRGGDGRRDNRPDNRPAGRG